MLLFRGGHGDESCQVGSDNRLEARLVKSGSKESSLFLLLFCSKFQLIEVVPRLRQENSARIHILKKLSRLTLQYFFQIFFLHHFSFFLIPFSDLLFKQFLSKDFRIISLFSGEWELKVTLLHF